jgi:hypothetical protein
VSTIGAAIDQPPHSLLLLLLELLDHEEEEEDDQEVYVVDEDVVVHVVSLAFDVPLAVALTAARAVALVPLVTFWADA